MDRAYWSRLGVDVKSLEERASDAAFRREWVESLPPPATILAKRFYGTDTSDGLVGHPFAVLEMNAACQALHGYSAQLLLEIADLTIPLEVILSLFEDDGPPLATTLSLALFSTHPSLLELARQFPLLRRREAVSYDLTLDPGTVPVFLTGPIDAALETFESDQQPPRSTRCVNITRASDGSACVLLRRTSLASTFPGRADSPRDMPTDWIVIDVAAGARSLRIAATSEEPTMSLVEAVMEAVFGAKVRYGARATGNDSAAVLAFLRMASFDGHIVGVVRTAYRSVRHASGPECVWQAGTRGLVGPLLLDSEREGAFTPEWLANLHEFSLTGDGCRLDCRLASGADGRYHVLYRTHCGDREAGARVADKILNHFGVVLSEEASSAA